MIEVKETSTVSPVCPHCQKEIQSIYCRKIKSFLGVRYIYFCEDCRKVLGVSHRKGFFMG